MKDIPLYTYWQSIDLKIVIVIDTDTVVGYFY